MKVYILNERFPYEGEATRGAFSTLELAHAEIARLGTPYDIEYDGSTFELYAVELDADLDNKDQDNEVVQWIDGDYAAR